MFDPIKIDIDYDSAELVTIKFLKHNLELLKQASGDDADDYVCDWDPYEAGYTQGFQDALDRVNGQESDHRGVQIERECENIHLYIMRNQIL
jgi:hypothetical protein